MDGRDQSTMGYTLEPDHFIGWGLGQEPGQSTVVRVTMVLRRKPLVKSTGFLSKTAK